MSADAGSLQARRSVLVALEVNRETMLASTTIDPLMRTSGRDKQYRYVRVHLCCGNRVFLFAECGGEKMDERKLQ